MTKELKGKNLSELYFKYFNECNEEALAKIIFTFAEKDGKNAFENMETVYDFIDDYKKENEKTYEDIYKEIAEVINDEGFFSKKMTKEELEEIMHNPLASINLEETMKTVVEKVATEIVQDESFKGHKA